MVGIPTVKSFCGCCELRVPCIVLALIRMIVYIAGVLAFLYFFVFVDGIFKSEQNRHFKPDQVGTIIRILFFVVSVNTLVSILFIVGVKSVRRHHYLYKCVSTISFDFRFFTERSSQNGILCGGCRTQCPPIWIFIQHNTCHFCCNRLFHLLLFVFSVYGIF